MDNLAIFNKREDLSPDLKEQAYFQLDRLLTAAVNTAGATQAGLPSLVDQLAWHQSHPMYNEQGVLTNLTCMPTALRTLFLGANPAVVNKGIADLALNNGEFLTTDKTLIRVNSESMKPGRGEKSFNPDKDQNRTEVGQLWDILAANIYWQRSSNNPAGEEVPVGSLSYRQIEDGARIKRQIGENLIAKTDPNGNVINHPYFTMDANADVYRAMTGEDGKARFLVSASAGGRDRPKVTVYDSKNIGQFEHLLSEGPWPKTSPDTHFEFSVQQRIRRTRHTNDWRFRSFMAWNRRFRL